MTTIIFKFCFAAGLLILLNNVLINWNISNHKINMYRDFYLRKMILNDNSNTFVDISKVSKI